jgi:purine-binding chemotaxis protein CheW
VSQPEGAVHEGVSEILTITEDLIQATPDVASDIAREFVSGIVATQNRMISLVALDGLIS